MTAEKTTYKVPVSVEAGTPKVLISNTESCDLKETLELEAWQACVWQL